MVIRFRGIVLESVVTVELFVVVETMIVDVAVSSPLKEVVPLLTTEAAEGGSLNAGAASAVGIR
jgi:hypothetical protein